MPGFKILAGCVTDAISGIIPNLSQANLGLPADWSHCIRDGISDGTGRDLEAEHPVGYSVILSQL